MEDVNFLLVISNILEYINNCTILWVLIRFGNCPLVASEYSYLPHA